MNLKISGITVKAVVLCALSGAFLSGGKAQAQLRNSAPSGFYIGVAATESYFKSGSSSYDANYDNAVKGEFNMLGAENAFKMENVWTGPTSYNWTNTDFFVNYAQQNNMAIRGHTLIWYQEVPWWLENGSYTNEQVTQMTRNYVTAIMTRYKGKIGQWDVVNEAIEDGGSYNTRNCFWSQKLGADWIKLGFQWARAADADAKLYYNDYGTEDMGPKSNATYNLVTSLRNSANNINGKVIIDGVGWQCHEAPFASGWRAYSDYYTNAQRLTNAGFDLMMTEVQFPIPNPVNTEKLQAQKDSYFQLVSLARNAGFKGVMTWGLTDKYVWIPSTASQHSAPLLYDTSYTKKAAYTGVKDALTSPGSSGGLSGLLKNPDFEFDASNSVAPVFWSSWSYNGTGNGAAYTENTGGNQNGNYHLTHYKGSNYQVTTLQNVYNVPNGNYKFRFYAKTSVTAGSGQTVKLYIKNYGGNEVTVDVPSRANSNGYTEIISPTFNITQGKVEIGFNSSANAGQWTYFDNCSLFLDGSTPAPTPYVNLALNPGFEAQQYGTQTPSNWQESSWTYGTGAGYTENTGGNKSGNYHNTHYASSNYDIRTYQTISNLQNGLYTFKAWVKSSGGQTEATMSASNYNTTGSVSSRNITASSDYTQIVIPDINVSNGQCQIAFWSRTNAYKWLYIDDVEFYKQ